jgi:hypothetical protein
MKLLRYCSCEAHTYQARHVGQDFVINNLDPSERPLALGTCLYYASTGVAHLITHPAVQVPRDAFKHRHGMNIQFRGCSPNLWLLCPYMRPSLVLLCCEVSFSF